MLARIRIDFSTPGIVLSMALAISLSALQAIATGGDEFDGLVKIRTEAIVPGSGPDARARALLVAEQDALYLFLQSTLDEDDLNTMGLIYERPWQYIHTSRIVSYSRVPKGTKIDAEVYLLTEQLRRDIAYLLLPKFDSSPKVIILFSQEVKGRDAVSALESGEAEMALRKLFEKSGFELFDAHELRRRYTNQELLDYIVSGDALVAKFARENNVDVIVLGKSVIAGYKPVDSQNIIRVTASVHGRVIRASDATLLDRFHAESVVSALDLNSAAQQAIQDSCEKVQENALAGATLGVAHQGSSNDIQLTFNMPKKTWRGKREIVAALRAMSNVTAIEELKPLNGTYRFRIAYDGPMKDFIHTLTDREYSDFRLEPARVVGYEVSLRVRNL